METRIRYQRTENTLVSNKTFDLNGRKVQVSIDLSTCTYKVYDSTTGETLKTGSDKTPAYVKKAAKAGLASLGYSFGNESRNRGSAAVSENTDSSSAA